MDWETLIKTFSFNPCFLGTCPRTPMLALDAMHSAVSILVFLELALGRLTIVVSGITSWFQSLFSWNLPSDIVDEYTEQLPRRVSILVFLELALGRITAILAAFVILGFNPCFLGTCPRTIFGTAHIQELALFQSLFSWNLPSDKLTNMCYKMYWFRFQSLFSWNLPSDSNQPLTLSMPIFCFNPCFLGTCPRTVYCLARTCKILILFQSLFSWNLPSDLEGLFQYSYGILFQSLFSWNLPSDSDLVMTGFITLDSFNPCFLGTCPRTFTNSMILFVYRGFQSLFSWNLPSDLYLVLN